MEPITLTTVAIIYVADKFLSQFLKEEGYGNLRTFFFPKKIYKQRLEEIIDETINEFEKLNPGFFSLEKSPFYYDKILFEILNRHILFKKYSTIYLVEAFKKKPNITIPKNEHLIAFYDLFTNKINKDKKIKELFFDENYKEEIFKLSSQLEELLNISNSILKKVSSIEVQVQSSGFQMEQLKNRFDEHIEIENKYQIQGLNSHPKIDKISLRASVVDDIILSFTNKTWIALHGNISLGKTQLAVLILERFPNGYWIEFKELECQVIFKVLFDEFSEYFKSQITSMKTLDSLVSEFPSGSILIFDDLPKLDLTKENLNNFISLTNIFKKYNVKLLTTSNFLLPQKFKEHFKEAVFEEQQIPYLQEEEAKEILISYGALEADAEILKGLVTSISEGHPTIVKAICIYLKENNWKIENDQIKELFSGDYASSLEDETYERIIKTVSDEDSKALLYRLKIIIGKIKGNQIEIIASVKPEISNPFEKVSNLSGLWVQKLKTNIYEISPLIKRIKNNNLSPALYKALNYSLGALILKDQRLDQIEANHAIKYFINAESYNKAGFVLALVLEESIKNSDIFFYWGFNSFWATTKLPKEMDLFLKSVIRYLQINILLQKNENVDFLINDLESIVDEASRAGINMAHAGVLLSLQLAQKNPAKSNQYLLLAISHSEQLKEFEKENVLKQASLNIETLIWNNLLHAKSLQEFNLWFDTFSKLSDEQKQNSLISEIYDLASFIFCSRIFDFEASKENPDWTVLILTFDEIIKKALSYNLFLLCASCYKFQIRCYNTYLKNVIKAIEIFDENFNKISVNKLAAFIIYDELGRQIYYNGQKGVAIKYLIEAAEINVPNIYTEKVYTYLALNEIFAEKDKSVAHEYILKAYNFQENNEFVNEVLSAKVIGELAISNWELGDKNETFYIIEEGIKKLLFTYKPLSDYKGIIIRYGHILNYYYHLTAGKNLPDVDGLPYSIPRRGFLTLTNDKLLEGNFYFEQRKFMLGYIMFNSFELLNDFQSSKKWAYLCFKLNEEEFLNPFASLLTGMNIYLIMDDKYEEAILKEIEILKSINALNSEKKSSENISNTYLEKILENRPKANFDSFDYLLFEYVINFITIRVLLNFMNSKSNETISTFLINIKNIKDYFDNKTAINIIERAFEYLIDEEKTNNDILELTNKQIDLSTQVSLLIYLIASLKSKTLNSLKLHLALIARLEMISNKLVPSQSAYKFIVIPFFETFWKIKIDNYQSDFFQYNFMVEKGLSKLDNVDTPLKLRELFNILCYHLEYNPSEKEEQWLKE